MNKANFLPALTAPFPLIFFFNLFFFVALEVILLTNPSELSLPKGITTFFSAFAPKLFNEEPKDPPD